jgi:hypothetical protein
LSQPGAPVAMRRPLRWITGLVVLISSVLIFAMIGPESVRNPLLALALTLVALDLVLQRRDHSCD